MTPIFSLTIDPPDGPRRKNCSRFFHENSLPFEFVEGFRADAACDLGAYSRLRNFLWSKRSLSRAEIAVYLGHRKIWQTIVERGIDVALVVEDDFSVLDLPAFRTVLGHAGDHATWDILKLFDFAPKRVVASHAWNGLTIVDYKYPASGCVAYLVTRDAATRLLARKALFRPVDEDISCCWEFGLVVRSVLPNIVEETSETLGGSLLEGSRQALRQSRNPLRRVIGVLLAGVKQIRARQHLRRNRGA
jgi:GR25 family glycosyltransferase involved in LPS biosynthesis